MTLSIRTRLLVWVIGGTALLLAVFAVAAYEVLSRSLVQSFDAALASTTSSLRSAVEQNDREVKADFAETDLADFHRAGQPDYFQIWREDGSLLASSVSAGATGLARFSGKQGEMVFRAVRLPDGRPGRAVGLLFVPTVDDEASAPPVPRKVTLVVARGTAQLDAEIGLLWWLLAIGAAATIVLSLVVGTVAVGQGLRPLEALARRVAGIRHDNLAAPVATERMPRELAPLVDRLNDLLSRLQEAFRRERTFTADAAHELRTPLAGLRSMLEVGLSRPRGAGEYREALAACLDIVLRTQVLVDDLLELSRLESGQTPARPEPVVLADVVEAAWHPFEGRALARRLIVERRIAPGLACTTDRAALLLALGAVFTNAVDYADTGGRIRIAAESDGGAIRLETSNTGCDLDPDAAAHVFERFWRGDISRAGAGAHRGLGLALAERAVATAGGTVSARVNDGIFTLQITLPVEPGAAS